MERSWKRIISPVDDSESSWSTEDSDGHHASIAWKRMVMSAKRQRPQNEEGPGSSDQRPEFAAPPAPSTSYPNPSDVLMHHDYVGTSSSSFQNIRSNINPGGMFAASPEERAPMSLLENFSWANYNEIFACYHRKRKPPIFPGMVDSSHFPRYAVDAMVSNITQNNDVESRPTIMPSTIPLDVINIPTSPTVMPANLDERTPAVFESPSINISHNIQPIDLAMNNTFAAYAESSSSASQNPAAHQSTKVEVSISSLNPHSTPESRLNHQIENTPPLEEVKDLTSPTTSVVDPPSNSAVTLLDNNGNLTASSHQDSSPVNAKIEETSSNELPESSQQDSLNEVLLGLLECPVCWEVMAPPFHQCRRGHLLCAPCRVRLSSCPTCRTTFTSCRNLAMEKVAEKLKYPCKNSSSGCTVLVLLREKREHEANCPHRLYSCLNPYCAPRWSCKLPTLQLHYQNLHPDMLVLGPSHIISVNYDFYRKPAASLDWILFAYQQLFRVNFHLIPTGEFYGCVQYIGPQNISRKYIYELKTELHQDVLRKVSFERTTHSDQMKVEKNYDMNDSFYLSANWTKRFLSESRVPRNLRKLEISVCVRPV